MVLARKCRPKILADVMGQQVVVQTITNSFNRNELHHAYLFAGHHGSGKTSTARILAAMENCLTSPGLTPCGTCSVCKKVFEGKHADITELDAASQAGKVKEIRELKNAASFSPIEGAKTKYFIIDECLPYNSQVSLANGFKVSIGDLVEEAMSSDRQESEPINDYVISRDMATGNLIEQKIKRYIKIPNDKQMYEIEIKDENGNVRTLRITGNHNVFVDGLGKVKAENLEIGQKLFLEGADRVLSR